MTSKEALEIIRSVDESISVEQTINECCDIVEKDLKILDILKKKLFIEKSDFNFIEDKLELITHSFENVKEKEIIKEWLEDDK